MPTNLTPAQLQWLQSQMPTNGNFWQQRLAVDDAGNTYFDEDGRPVLELSQGNVGTR